jgi:CMP-N,N'-diacetyllegionaminic acid synthase
MQKKIIALIPARSGSERLKNKNILKLNNKPLIYYSIRAAMRSKIFKKIFVSTDSKEYKKISERYGAEVNFLRPAKYARSNSPDYDWVNYTISKLKKMGHEYDFFFILRPTNPFRTHKTILRAWKKFNRNINIVESLRAIEVCRQHPYKMWSLKNKFMKPLFKKILKKQPGYNMQMKSLPRIYVQNASLEISKVSNLKKYKTITGKKIIPFFTNKMEGFDINYEIDLIYANKLFTKNI